MFPTTGPRSCSKTSGTLRSKVTAKIIATDAEHRQATLQFKDGTTRTVAVRPDVDLSKRKVGETVVLRTTGALAIRVEKP